VQIRIESDREKITGSIMFILLLIAISTLCIYLVYRAYLTNQLSKRLYSLAKDHYEHRDMFIATKLKGVLFRKVRNFREHSCNY
jgi:hypothetical protein